MLVGVVLFFRSAKKIFAGFWVVHFGRIYAKFLVEIFLKWAPQGHSGFHGGIWGGSCQTGPMRHHELAGIRVGDGAVGGGEENGSRVG